MYTVILNTGKHFLKKKIMAVTNSKKKKKRKSHGFLLYEELCYYIGDSGRNYKSISVPHYTEQKLCQCHMELYS